VAKVTATMPVAPEAKAKPAPEAPLAAQEQLSCSLDNPEGCIMCGS
jgi:hypothetical protein